MRITDDGTPYPFAMGPTDDGYKLKINNMKPFNLEDALAGKPVVTRDGRPYKFAGYNPDADKYHKITGWMDNSIVAGHSEGGAFNTSATVNDLFMKAETKTVYNAVIKSEGGRFFTTCLYDSIDELNKILANTYTHSEVVKIHETEVEI